MVLTLCSIHGLNSFLHVISSHTHVIGWFLCILLSTLLLTAQALKLVKPVVFPILMSHMLLNLGNNDEYNTAVDENTGLSGTVSGNDGNLRDITFFLHTT